MGHDHIRFVLMVAFFFSTCLIASCGSEMEIIRFSGTYPLTHSERVVQLTESITRSEREKKVTKVASLARKTKKERRSNRRRRTTKEFEMRQKSSSYEIEKQTFSLAAASTMTQGTTTDHQNRRWSRPTQPTHLCDCDSSIGGGGGQQSSSNHESSQEFTTTYSESGTPHSSCSTFLVCQKVSVVQRKLSEWTIGGKKGRNGNGVVKAEEKQVQQQEHRFETQNSPLIDDDDQRYKPIFFVYPPKRPDRSGRKKKVENDDGMDYYQPTFHLDFQPSSSSKGKNEDSSVLLEYDPRIMGGFDSYGEDVSFYLDGSSGQSNEKGFGSTGKKSSNIANASSYDELCKELLLEYG